MGTKAEKTKVYNVIIMDRSGSMWDIQRPAIMGFNEVLGGVKAAKEKYAETQEQLITLVLFDSSSIDYVYWNADPSEAKILTEETYVPGASTPLYDAMGRTLTRLDKELASATNCSVVVTVITDGLENASCEYSLAAVQSLIGHLKAKGWSFAYMGTDHDVQGVTVSLSITNVIQFEKSEEETIRTFNKERHAREAWGSKLDEYCRTHKGATEEERIGFCKSMAEEYYKEPELNPAYADRVTPARVTRLDPNEVFVFGSNRDGSHTGGAAATAVRKFGAQVGVAEGPQGSSYAIPTTGQGVTADSIHAAFIRLLEYAIAHPEKTFLVTALGCGHAGYGEAYMASLLEEGIRVPNIHFPIGFWREYEMDGLIDNETIID